MKSEFVTAVDGIQRALRPLFAERGYRLRGRTYSHLTADGLTQVVNFQMGPFDPPGTTYHEGLREDHYGLFTVNLGVYVPEVADVQGNAPRGPTIREYHCCVRTRLGRQSKDGIELWWRAVASEEVLDDLRRRLISEGFPLLDRFDSRDAILREWHGATQNLETGSTPRVVMAIILLRRGESAKARELLAAQARDAVAEGMTGHADYVRQLADRLGVALDLGKG